MPLSLAMRDLLIEHMDGRPVTLTPSIPKDRRPLSSPPSRRGTINSLIVNGLLRTSREGDTYVTRITEAGRAALASELADWAEALMRANEHGFHKPPHRTTESFWKLLDQFSRDRREQPDYPSDKPPTPL